MNEVRDIVARMMEEPAPPPRPADEVLAVARRARRRSWAVTSGSGALAVVMIVAVGVGVRSLQIGAPTDAPAASPAEPVAAAAPAHGAVMAQRIVAALPAGMTAGSAQTFSDATRPAVASEGTTRVLAAAVVRVFAAGREGEIFAYLMQDGAARPAEACAGVGDACQVLTVAGVSVRVVTGFQADRGARVEATRFLTGGRLVVGAWQGPPVVVADLFGDEIVHGWLAPLAAPPDAQWLATLAADPAMLPA